MNFTQRNIEFLLTLGDLALSTSFIDKLRYWRKKLKGKKEDLENLQALKLKEMLRFASQNSEHYAKLDIKETEDPYTWLRKFPILPKQKLKDDLDSFLTRKDLDKLVGITSSGSTGAPSKVYFSKSELSNNRALQIIWWEWAGYQFGKSLLQTGVNTKRSFDKKVKDKLLNTRYIDAVTHDEKQILEELEILRKEPRAYFVGYASSIFLFAKIAKKYGIRDVKFDGVISIGEKLLPNFRQEIEEAFSCSVFDTYGASEGFLIASQCTYGKYHLMSPHLVLEILDENDQEVKPGETGRVILTGLDNFTTPLIRYEVGDLAIKGNQEPCKCGLELPVIEEVIGRITEFILTEKGKFITVQTVVRLMKNFSQVDQFKFIQLGENRLEVEMVSSETLDDTFFIAVQNEIERVVGEKFEIEFKQLDQISKAKSGKFQLIENRFNQSNAKSV
ncbi:phenylacetate--CoA ligase family protein [Algoriphagus namhaensis]|uniref:Phenylacetate--CoA ligase family protein n=1 Tax=Algoriphagus namhaensis TaxID=915353 RepID=A0ABV8ATF5_9BACT